jgi:hypothetical protein
MPECTTVTEVGLTLTHFSPSEAETITLTPMPLQRAWRSRGYLPLHNGTARFDVFALSEMLALKLLADRTGPLLARHIATVCGQGIAWRVLGGVDAYEGDYGRVGEWDADAFTSRQRNDRLGLELLNRTRAGEALPSLSEMRAMVEAGGPAFDRCGWLRDRIFRARGTEGMPNRFLIWFADGRYEWCDSLDTAFDNRGSWDPRFAGAVLLLDLDALAKLIVERAGRAFVCVELPQ